MINADTFTKNRERIFPKREFHPKQTDFFKFALETINSDRDTSKITIFPARCGIGKTSFLRILIKSWLADNSGRGLIIVTDNLQRLGELNDENDYRIAYLTAENKATEIIRQGYCPILLISTQRYFQMDSIEPFLTYKNNDIEYKRDTVIFDETPYFFTDSELGIDQLNTFHSALNEGISDLYDGENKKWLLTQYDVFRQKMIDTINGLEQRRNQTTYLFYKPDEDSITEDDSRFYGIIEKNEDIFRKYPAAKNILSDISFYVKNGGFFTSSKLKDSNIYHKSFILRKSHKDKFMLGTDVKSFILDASAETSEQYSEYAEWMDILDCDDFNVPLDFLNLHIININTSRNSLISKSDNAVRLNAIKNYIKNLSLDTEDTLFVTYKALLEKNTFSDIDFTTANSMYFGNVKGFNDRKDMHTFIQVGTNRQSNITYLLNLISYNDDFEGQVKDGYYDIDRNIRIIDSLLKSDLVESYMCAEVVADFIQNLYRTKARDMFNTEEVNAYLFCTVSDNLMMELKYAFERIGAKIDVAKPEELIENKIRNRKGDTVAKRILNWLDCRAKGEFDIAEMFSDLDLDNAGFKTVKRSNPLIKKRFNEMKIPGTRGKYLVA